MKFDENHFKCITVIQYDLNYFLSRYSIVYKCINPRNKCNRRTTYYITTMTIDIFELFLLILPLSNNWCRPYDKKPIYNQNVLHYPFRLPISTCSCTTIKRILIYTIN